MVLKLASPNKKDLFFDAEKLGRLYIFALVFGAMKGLYKEIASVEKVAPPQYVRVLVKYVCHPEGRLEEGRRPKQPTLTDEEISLILRSRYLFQQ